MVRRRRKEGAVRRRGREGAAPRSGAQAQEGKGGRCAGEEGQLEEGLVSALAFLVVPDVAWQVPECACACSQALCSWRTS